MTERGLPIVDGAPACPFVAFDEDRDERATSPDHRHRCYAEIRPAPRALAHQEAYCLSSAFPVCPTFQDWARREAARARRDEVPVAAAPEVEDNGRLPRRDWTAPPPWVADAPLAPGGRRYVEGASADDQDDEDEEVAPIPARGGGLSGGFADRMIGRDAEEPRAFVPPPAAAPIPPAPRRAPTPVSADEELDRDADDEDDWRDEEDAAADRPPTRRRRGAAGAALAAAGIAGDRQAADAHGPAWERPHRLEAYPTIRDRRMPGASIGGSRVLLGFAAILIAAVALFFLPTLLGIGAPSATPRPSGASSAGPSVAPSAAAVTAVPAPTEQTYVVQAGDTMSRIAAKFGVTLQSLIDANKTTVPNPDALQIGDKVIIPTVAPTSLPNAPSPAATK